MSSLYSDDVLCGCLYLCCLIVVNRNGWLGAYIPWSYVLESISHKTIETVATTSKLAICAIVLLTLLISRICPEKVQR